MRCGHGIGIIQIIQVEFKSSVMVAGEEGDNRAFVEHDRW
jgi:hypothetical protein